MSALEQTDGASFGLMEQRWKAVKTSRGKQPQCNASRGRGGSACFSFGCAESFITESVRRVLLWEKEQAEGETRRTGRRRWTGFQCQGECPAGEDEQMLQPDNTPPAWARRNVGERVF